MSCHNSASGFILGPRTGQLNGAFTYPNGSTDNQLRAWDHIGLFKMEIRKKAMGKRRKHGRPRASAEPSRRGLPTDGGIRRGSGRA